MHGKSRKTHVHVQVMIKQYRDCGASDYKKLLDILKILFYPGRAVLDQILIDATGYNMSVLEASP